MARFWTAAVMAAIFALALISLLSQVNFSSDIQWSIHSSAVNSTGHWQFKAEPAHAQIRHIHPQENHVIPRFDSFNLTDLESVSSLFHSIEAALQQTSGHRTKTGAPGPLTKEPDSHNAKSASKTCDGPLNTDTAMGIRLVTPTLP